MGVMTLASDHFGFMNHSEAVIQLHLPVIDYPVKLLEIMPCLTNLCGTIEHTVFVGDRGYEHLT